MKNSGALPVIIRGLFSSVGLVDGERNGAAGLPAAPFLNG
jgi:hypothetical protein